MKPLNGALVARCDLPVGGQRRAARPGLSLSTRPGPGNEMHASRPYTPGDDPRRIDWNATARSGEMQVRTTLADVAVDVHLCPLLSGSMRFGTAERKHTAAAEALRFLTAVAARRNEQIFVHDGPGRSLRLPPRHATGLVEDLFTELPTWSATGDLPAVLAALGSGRAPSLVVVVLDLLVGDEVLGSLRALAASRGVCAVLVHDPAEWDLPAAGRLRLLDPTSGRTLRVDTSSATVRTRYRRRVEERHARISEGLTAPGCVVVEISTAEEVDAAMARQLPRRR